MITVNVENNPVFKKLYSLELDKIATTTGFSQRQRKVSPKDFLVTFFVITLQGSYSLSNWAIQLGIAIGKTVSKQGVWKRLSFKHAQFLEAVLKKAICSDIEDFASSSMISKISLFKNFKRVLIQDSTLVHLPDYLSEVFKGNTSKGKRKALAKIQAVIDIKVNRFINLELKDFSENDQKSAHLTLSIIKAGDLIIRDLGYYVISVFQQIIDKKAFFISKLRYGINLYNIDGKELSLSKELRRQVMIDKKVLMGKQKVPVRIIARKLDHSIADERRRKARNNRDKRLNHNEEYYFLLGYNIYITNIEEPQMSLYQVVQAYSLRWRIEIIFKTWKSHLYLDQCLDPRVTNPEKVRILFFYLLIFTVMVQTRLYNYYWFKTYSNYKRYLSLMKFTRFLSDNLLILLVADMSQQQLLEEIIAKGCSYETRKTPNYIQKLIQFNKPLS